MTAFVTVIFFGVAFLSFGSDAADKKMVGVLTGANFNSQVERSEIPVFVDIWATWCGPCRTYGPIVDAVAKIYQGKIAFFRLDASNPANREIMKKYEVNAIPTTLIFVHGKLVDQWVGLISKKEVKAGLRKLLKSYSKSESKS